MVFGIFDKKRKTRREEYDGYKYKGGPDTTKDLAIDGKSFNYRDPSDNKDVDYMSGKGPAMSGKTINKDSYQMTNPLYEYSYGQIRDAAKAQGIQNINEKAEVDKILSYIQTPRTAAVEPTKPDKPKKDKDAKLGAPTEPVKTVLSKPAAEANAFVEAHNAMTMGNENPLAGIAASNQAGVSSPEAGAFKQNFQLNLGSSDSTPLTFTEAVTGTEPSIAGGFMGKYKDAIKRNLEPT
jgi:hypothetical protein